MIIVKMYDLGSEIGRYVIYDTVKGQRWGIVKIQLSSHCKEALLKTKHDIIHVT